MGRKSISTLYAEWEKTSEEAKKLAEELGRRYKSSGMRATEVTMLTAVWVALKYARRLADAIVHYPKAVDYEHLIQSSVFDDVVSEMANCRRGWPSEALPALKKWTHQGYHGHPAYVHQHVLHRLAQEKDFKVPDYRGKVKKYGTASLCARLIDEDRTIEHYDIKEMIERFKGEKQSHSTHPLVTLAQAKKFPSRMVEPVVRTLLEVKQFWSACEVVKNAGRDDLLPVLEDYAMDMELYDIQRFLKDFPQANKEKFREVVRKLITPDPEEMIDAFLHGGRHSRRAMMAMHAMPIMVCGPRGPWDY